MVRGVSQRVSIDVERGAADGHQIRISGGGDEHPSYKTGDLIFRVVAAAHPRFRRDGNDLWVHHAITLRESLLGFDAQLVHLDGHAVRLRSDRVTAPHTLMRITGEGMPVHNFRNVGARRSRCALGHHTRKAAECRPAHCKKAK